MRTFISVEFNDESTLLWHESIKDDILDYCQRFFPRIGESYMINVRGGRVEDIRHTLEIKDGVSIQSIKIIMNKRA